MTPQEAFQERVGVLFAEYDSGQIGFSEALIRLENDDETLREAFAYRDETPADVLNMCFEAYSRLYLMAYTKGHVLPGELEVGLENHARMVFPGDNENEIQSHLIPVQVELMTRDL